MARYSFTFAIVVLLVVTPVVNARQKPAAADPPVETAAEAQRAPAGRNVAGTARKPDLTAEFSRLFPARTGIYVEIPHLATLVDQFGGSDPLLQLLNERFGDDVTARTPTVLTSRELTAVLDSSVAIATVPESAKAVATMSFDERAMVVVVHCSSKDAPALLRDKLLAPLAESRGARRGSITARGYDVVVYDDLAIVVSDRTVVFGARHAVVTLIDSAATDGPRIGDLPGYATAVAKHAGGQDHLFVFVNGDAMAQSFAQSLGVYSNEMPEEAKAKLSPHELGMREATRNFFGLNAVLGLASGARVDGDSVKVRYDVEIDRSVNGLASVLADPPSIQFRAAKYVPSYCGSLQSIAADPVRIFDLVEQYFGPVPPASNGKGFAQQVEEIEDAIGVGLRSELLPALGREIAFTESFGFLGGVRPMRPPGKGDAPKPVRVLLVEVRDREPIRKMIAKSAPRFPNAPPLAAVDYKGAELWDAAGFAVAFVDDFAIAGQSDDVKRCVDSVVAEDTLSKQPSYQSVSSEWLGGAIVATYTSADFEADRLESSAKSQEELRKQIEIGDGSSFDVEQMFAWQAVSTLTNPLGATVLRNATGVNWENSSPTGPISTAYAKLTREWIVDGPRRQRIEASHSAAIGAMNILVSAEQAFREKSGRFGLLEELKSAGSLDEESKQLIANDLSGYRLEVAATGAGTESRFTVTATPVMYGRTAKLSLFIDETGILRGIDKQGAVARGDDPRYPPDPPPVEDLPVVDGAEFETYADPTGPDGELMEDSGIAPVEPAEVIDPSDPEPEAAPPDGGDAEVVPADTRPADTVIVARPPPEAATEPEPEPEPRPGSPPGSPPGH